MELQQILSKMEADGWEIADNFKKAHGHFLQYFLETVEEELRKPFVMGQSEQFICGANRVMGEKRCERQCGQCEELYPQTNCR